MLQILQGTSLERGCFRPFSTQVLEFAGSGSAVIPHRESRLEPKDRAQSGHGEERIPRAMMPGAIGPCTSEPTVEDA
jgi:hypothetical protein